MRELVVENQEVLVIPQNFRSVNIGKVRSVNAADFVLELSGTPKDLAVNTFCEFYTQTPRGKLYFDSYPKAIDGNKITIACPAKHKFLQRRQYTRVKFVNDTQITDKQDVIPVKTLDISAGGVKLMAYKSLDIDKDYEIDIKISAQKIISCIFQPIRIEKSSEEKNYLASGRFKYSSNYDRMLLTQYCAKRSIEIKNK